MSEQLKAALEAIAAENDASLSETASAALEKFADRNKITITLEAQAIKKLQLLSEANYRSIDDQTRMIIMEWINAQEAD